MEGNKKYCVHCGAQIDADSNFCTKCGKQVVAMQNNSMPGNIVINNIQQTAVAGGVGFPKPKNKWTAFLLCLFLGYFGAHKFYEGKVIMGILYLFTVGLFGIGWIVDIILLLLKPNPYYV